MSELDQLRQEAEQLKNQIRVSNQHVSTHTHMHVRADLERRSNMFYFFYSLFFLGCKKSMRRCHTLTGSNRFLSFCPQQAVHSV